MKARERELMLKGLKAERAEIDSQIREMEAGVMTEVVSVVRPGPKAVPAVKVSAKSQWTPAKKKALSEKLKKTWAKKKRAAKKAAGGGTAAGKSKAGGKAASILPTT